MQLLLLTRHLPVSNFLDNAHYIIIIIIIIIIIGELFKVYIVTYSGLKLPG